MKIILIALAFSAALLPQTETKPALEQVRSRAAYSGVIVLYNGALVVARLDSSVVIDMSGGTPTIRAVAILPVPVEEEFSPAEGQAAFTLTGTPAPGTLEVFRNGVRMRVGRDFTAAGKVVTFTLQPTAAGDLIVARRWPGG